MVSAEQARNLVWGAGLEADDKDEILLLINTEPEATLRIFEGLRAEDIKGVVEKHLKRLRNGEKDCTSYPISSLVHVCRIMRIRYVNL